MTSAEGSQAALAWLLSQIAHRPGCHVLPVAAPARGPDSVRLPEDLRQLYELCGGLLLFETAPFPRRLCGPDTFVPASPRLLTPKVAQQTAQEDPADLTNHCYVIVDGCEGLSTEPHIVMDLSPERAGRCYAVAWDTYGLAGEMPLVATTVVELLHVLLTDEGRDALPASKCHGDAYDL